MAPAKVAADHPAAAPAGAGAPAAGAGASGATVAQVATAVGARVPG